MKSHAIRIRNEGVSASAAPRTMPVALSYGAGAWAACALTMGLAMWLMPEPAALACHAALAPLLGASVGLLYRRRHSGLSPAAFAALVASVIVVLDVVVVAAVVLGSFEMLGSVLGLWGPLAMLFAACWLSGWWAAGRSGLAVAADRPSARHERSVP